MYKSLLMNAGRAFDQTVLGVGQEPANYLFNRFVECVYLKCLP